jgi:DNA-directed RNA polymerase specialized sigma subunit
MELIPMNLIRPDREGGFERAVELLDLCSLTRDERRVITARYICDMNFSRIQRCTGIPRVQAKRLHDGAILKLKEALRGKV